MKKYFSLFFILFVTALFYIHDSASLVPETKQNNTHENGGELPTSDSSLHTDSLLFVGDVMLGRHVETLMRTAGLAYPFSNIRSLLFDSTYVIANLEGPIPEKHTQTKSNGFNFSFQSDVVSALSNYHISAVSLANNHTSDQGEKGYQNTVSELLKHNIASFGYSPYFKANAISNTVSGKTVTTIGINLITPYFDEDATIEGVKNFCFSHQDEIVIAFIHAGTEYTHFQSGQQVSFSHKLLAETCVQTIIGSHPHVVQGVEKVNGKFVFYSLGNFIFDQYFSKATQEGLTIKVAIDEGKLTFTLIPIVQELSVPRIADRDERESILATIASSSDPSLREDILKGFLKE